MALLGFSKNCPKLLKIIPVITLATKTGWLPETN